jgi:hypothetical protein
MAKHLLAHFFAAAAIVVVTAGGTTAGERVTDASIRFALSGDTPRIEISLGTNPAILEPMPSPLDFEAQMAYQQRLMAFGQWDDPNVEITILMTEGVNGNLVPSSDGTIISKGVGVSFDPEYYSIANKIRHIGNVNILEFTPNVFEARYSAELFSTRKPREPISEGAVNGWFRISLPGLSDPRRDNEVSDGEKVRLNAAAMWDTLRGTGMALDDADAMSGGGGAGGAATAAVPQCDCRCEVVLELPASHECIRPGAQCTEQRRLCALPPPTAGDLDAIIDLMLGPDAPPEARAAVLPSLQDLTPEELAQMLQFYRQATGQQP